MFSVDEAAAPARADLEPGERVWITYVRVDDQLRAHRIEKLPAPQRPQWLEPPTIRDARPRRQRLRPTG